MEYKNITKIMVWIIAISTVAYFVLLPVSFTRPTPKAISPTQQSIQANPLQSLIPMSTINTNTTITTNTIEVNPINPTQE